MMNHIAYRIETISKTFYTEFRKYLFLSQYRESVCKHCVTCKDRKEQRETILREVMDKNNYKGIRFECPRSMGREDAKSNL